MRSCKGMGWGKLTQSAPSPASCSARHQHTTAPDASLATGPAFGGCQARRGGGLRRAGSWCCATEAPKSGFSSFDLGPRVRRQSPGGNVKAYPAGNDEHRLRRRGVCSRRQRVGRHAQSDASASARSPDPTALGSKQGLLWSTSVPRKPFGPGFPGRPKDGPFFEFLRPLPAPTVGFRTIRGLGIGRQSRS